MLKPYHNRGDLDGCQYTAIAALLEHKSIEEPVSGQEVKEEIRLKNSDIWTIWIKLRRLRDPEKDMIKSILQEFPQMLQYEQILLYMMWMWVMQGRSISMHIG